MSCHAAGCTTEDSWFRSRVLKRRGYYLQSQWFCSEKCLEDGVLQKLQTQKPPRKGSRPASFQLKLEHALVASGVITRDQLAGNKTDIDLQQHLLDLGLVTERDITLALSRIYNIPFINLSGRRVQANALNTIPAEIVRTHDFFPLEFLAGENRLVLVTSNPASVPVMINLRGILGWQVGVYLNSESVVRAMIDQYCDLSEQSKRAEKREQRANIDNPRDIACWIVERARTIDAQSLRIARFGEFTWTRFFVGEDAWNLVL
jgi:MshEN domain